MQAKSTKIDCITHLIDYFISMVHRKNGASTDCQSVSIYNEYLLEIAMTYAVPFHLPVQNCEASPWEGPPYFSAKTQQRDTACLIESELINIGG